MNENTPNPQLKHVKKVYLNKGESKNIDINIKVNAFGLFDDDGEKYIKAGKYILYIGTSQPDKRSICLKKNEVEQFVLTAQEEIVLDS